MVCVCFSVMWCVWDREKQREGVCLVHAIVKPPLVLHRGVVLCLDISLAPPTAVPLQLSDMPISQLFRPITLHVSCVCVCVCVCVYTCDPGREMGSLTPASVQTWLLCWSSHENCCSPQAVLFSVFTPAHRVQPPLQSVTSFSQSVDLC